MDEVKLVADSSSREKMSQGVEGLLGCWKPLREKRSSGGYDKWGRDMNNI